MGLAGLEFLDNAVLEARAEFFRLLLHAQDQVGAINAIRKAGEIFHSRGRGQLAAGESPLQDERGEVGPGSVDGGGESGTSGADDDDILHRGAK